MVKDLKIYGFFGIIREVFDLLEPWNNPILHEKHVEIKSKCSHGISRIIQESQFMSRFNMLWCTL